MFMRRFVETKNFWIMTAKEMTETIVKKHGEMETDMMAYVEKGSNAAARRARSASLELAKLYKEYRRITLEEAKKKKEN